MTVWGCKDKKETEGPSVSADELCKTYAKHLEGCEPNPEMGQDLCDPPSEAECREEITSIQEGCKNGESVLKCMVDSKELMGLARCRDDCKMSEAGASGVAKAVKAEAVDMLDKIYKGAASYYGQPRVDSSGNITACQFPESIDWTPKGVACEGDGKRFKADPSPWDEVVWSALNFQISGRHYGQYKIESSGTLGSAKATLSARVDPDCDGKYTVYSRTIQGDPEGTMAGCKVQSGGSDLVETTE